MDSSSSIKKHWLDTATEERVNSFLYRRMILSGDLKASLLRQKNREVKIVFINRFFKDCVEYPVIEEFYVYESLVEQECNRIKGLQIIAATPELAGMIRLETVEDARGIVIGKIRQVDDSKRNFGEMQEWDVLKILNEFTRKNFKKAEDLGCMARDYYVGR